MSRIYRANRKPKGNIKGPLSPTGSKIGDFIHAAQVRVGSRPKPTPPKPSPKIKRKEKMKIRKKLPKSRPDNISVAAWAAMKKK